jgi:hypothetical protein
LHLPTARTIAAGHSEFKGSHFADKFINKLHRGEFDELREEPVLLPLKVFGGMDPSCAVGAGEAIGSVGDRTGSSGVTWLNASDNAECEGTDRRLSQSRSN